MDSSLKIRFYSNFVWVRQ